jgi:hypothetical protein
MSRQQSMSMPGKYDIVIETSDRSRILVVECKRMSVTTPADAAHLRRSLQSYSGSLSSDYFMLALPNCLFLWKGDAHPDAPPEFSASAKPVLQSYLGTVADRPGGPRPQSLEIAISSWLGDLASSIRKPDPASEPERMMLDSGLFERLRGGIVKTHVAA